MVAHSVHVPNERRTPRARARLLTATRVDRHRPRARVLGVAVVTTAEVLVEGRASISPCSPTSRPPPPRCTSTSSDFVRAGVGDLFAQALAEKARSGVPVRLVVDEQAHIPFYTTRDFYAALAAAGVEIVVTRATKPRASAGPLTASSSPTRWKIRALGRPGDHRKAVVIDGQIGWVGGAGIEDQLPGTLQDATETLAEIREGQGTPGYHFGRARSTVRCEAVGDRTREWSAGASKRLVADVTSSAADVPAALGTVTSMSFSEIGQRQSGPLAQSIAERSTPAVSSKPHSRTRSPSGS